MTLRAQVRNGRLELSEPAELAEGEIFELVPVEEAYADDREVLDEDQIRAKVLAAYERSRIEIANGDCITFEAWRAKRQAARQR